jgi:hypothetical protein
MTIINFLLFLLSGVGITNLVVNASIFDKIRNFITAKSGFFGKLISCMMCSGFWVGLILSFIFGIHPVVAGATISLLAYKLGYIIDYLDMIIALKAKELEKTESNMKTEEDEDTDG